MPWTVTNADRHNKSVKSPQERKQWSSIANAILKKTGNEGQAIRIASGAIKRRLRR